MSDCHLLGLNTTTTAIIQFNSEIKGKLKIFKVTKQIFNYFGDIYSGENRQIDNVLIFEQHGQFVDQINAQVPTFFAWRNVL